MTQERPELRKREANFRALTPISFVERAAKFFGARTAVIHGPRVFVGVGLLGPVVVVAHRAPPST